MTTEYTASLTAEQLGDIVLNPKTRLGGKGSLDKVAVEIEHPEGQAEVVGVTTSEDKLTHTVGTNGNEGTAKVTITADKDMSPDAEDNDVAIFHITVLPAGTEAVAFEFKNVRERQAEVGGE